MKNNLSSIIFFSLLSTILFGILDASFFLVGELTIQKFFRYYLGLNLTMSELATGGLSAAISIFASTYLNQYLKSKKIQTIELPIIDAFGIILGTILIMMLYNLLDLESNTEFTNV